MITYSVHFFKGPAAICQVFGRYSASLVFKADLYIISGFNRQWVIFPNCYIPGLHFKCPAFGHGLIGIDA